jgi:hypothetical protein
MDSSETMAQFREEAAETIWVLAKLLKPRVTRRDSVKLSILGNPDKVYSLSTSTKFANVVKHAQFRDSTAWLLGLWYVREKGLVSSSPDHPFGPANGVQANTFDLSRLQGIVADIANGLATKPSPPISLYILTDGEFGQESPNFASPIGELIRQLRENQTLMPTFLSVTIIQFGDGADAHQALRSIQQSVASMNGLPPAL